MNITELLKQAHESQASDITVKVSVNDGALITFRVRGDLKLFKECTYEDVTALWKSIHECQDGKIDTDFNPLNYPSGLCGISDQSKLPVEYRAVKFVSQPNLVPDSGFILVMRLLYKLPTENLEITSLGYSKEQQADLDNFIKSDEIKVAVIAGHTSKFPRHI